MSIHPRDSQKVFQQLSRIFRGDLLFDEISRLAYASAACIYRIEPLGVACPRDVDDLRRLVTFAAEEGIPLTARGGGSGRAGQGIGSGIIVDFTRYMNRLVHVDVAADRFRVQPGIFLTRLNRLLAGHGKFFPPDPSSGDCASIGGMIANNSSGPHCPMCGDTRSHVRSLELVCADGTVERFSPIAVESFQWQEMMGESRFAAHLHAGVRDIATKYAALLREKKPETTKNCCGYDLWDVYRDGIVNLAALITGSEGTLALVTEAELSMASIPRASLSALVYFDAIEPIGAATGEILAYRPAMLEIMERTILELARERWPELQPFLPPGIEALLFIEFQGDDKDELTFRMETLEHRLMKELGIAVGFRMAATERERQIFIRVRKASGPVLNTMRGSRRPAVFIEDTAVHPRRLSEFITGMRNIFARYGVQAAIYGHAGDGNLHITPFLNFMDPGDIMLMKGIADETYELVLRLRGTISAEHGDGLLRSAYVQRQYGQLYEAMVAVKRLFDPRGIFNPGRIVDAEPDSLIRHLKYSGISAGHADTPLLASADIREEVLRCSGCGQCRAYCPVADVLGDELSSARAKATLLRETIFGGSDPSPLLSSPSMKAVFDRCMTCQQCLVECPTAVDIPALVTWQRAHYISKKGYPLAGRLLANTELISRMGSLGAPLSNLAGRTALIRFVLEAVANLDRRAPLPDFTRQTFRKRLKEGSSERKGTVAYFSSCFGNYCNPQGEPAAVMTVLEKNGFRVIVPETRCCGMARIAAGLLDDVRGDVLENMRILMEFARDGIPILFSDPSCLMAVKREYPRILGLPESRMVSEACQDVMRFVLQLLRRGELCTEFGEIPLRVAYHNPCHLKALGGGGEVRELLSLIPGIEWVDVLDSCCGLAGTFGMKKGNYPLSAAIGDALFRAMREAHPTRVLTGCGACQLQIMQGTGIPAIHPIHILASAYARTNLPAMGQSL